MCNEVEGQKGVWNGFHTNFAKSRQVNWNSLTPTRASLPNEQLEHCRDLILA